MTEKIQNFISAINNNLETRNSEKTDVAEAENIIERALNLKYTKVWQLKNTNSTKLKDSIFLDKHASALMSGKDQKEIYTIILKDINKKYWSKFDKAFFPNNIDVELSQDPRGNVRID